ncbi:MAG TPA: oligogalacturonate lyase family protein [Opitutaceae bacterium]|nr:oligogalacturonate lyase family protein [Opitutaceae bacterium]
MTPRHFVRLCSVAAILSLQAFAAETPAPASPPAPALPSDWIDPDTGHRIIRLSPDSGGSSLYFHQRSYTPEGDKLIIHTSEGLVTVDLTTLGVSQPKLEVVAPGARAIATAWKTREAYVRRDGVIVAIHLDTKAEREVVKLPEQARRGAFALNCDETLLVGIAPDPDGTVQPRTPPPNGMGGTLEPQWAAGTPKMIYTIDVKTGKMKVIHRENDWTNHLQCSPTDPLQILFCHEGPWHYNDRTWTIRADGSPARLLHERTMNMEIQGHEFFGHDGKTVWYDLQTPRSTVFWLAGVDLATGHRTWYNLRRDEWSVHYNVSPDGKFFAGDGGYPGSVAARSPDGETITPAAQGQWIYLFRPVMVRGNSFRDKKELIDIGTFKSERLVNMANHNYSKTTGVEPNLTFTPDGKWIIFSGNFHSPANESGKKLTHTYAVEIAKAQK